MRASERRRRASRPSTQSGQRRALLVDR